MTLRKTQASSGGILSDQGRVLSQQVLGTWEELGPLQILVPAPLTCVVLQWDTWGQKNH